MGVGHLEVLLQEVLLGQNILVKGRGTREQEASLRWEETGMLEMPPFLFPLPSLPPTLG